MLILVRMSPSSSNPTSKLSREAAGFCLDACLRLCTSHFMWLLSIGIEELQVPGLPASMRDESCGASLSLSRVHMCANENDGTTQRTHTHRSLECRRTVVYTSHFSPFMAYRSPVPLPGSLYSVWKYHPYDSFINRLGSANEASLYM